MNKDLTRIERELDNIIVDLLTSARATRNINDKVLKKFYELLDELVEKNKGEEFIPRKIAGLLFFIYISLDSNIQNNNYKDPLFLIVADVQDYLDKILWDSPFKGGY